MLSRQWWPFASAGAGAAERMTFNEGTVEFLWFTWVKCKQAIMRWKELLRPQAMRPLSVPSLTRSSDQRNFVSLSLTVCSKGEALLLNPDIFAKNFRVARRGPAGAPSGMTSSNQEDVTRVLTVRCAEVPEHIVQVVRLGRLAASGALWRVTPSVVLSLLASTACLHGREGHRPVPARPVHDVGRGVHREFHPSAHKPR